MDTTVGASQRGLKTSFRHQINKFFHRNKIIPADRIDKIYLGLLIILILIGGYFRLINPMLAEFKEDEAFWCVMADEILQGEWPTRGQLKGGLNVESYGGPIVGYLIALSYLLFGRHPVSGSILIALLNIIGIYLTFSVGKKIFNKRVGIVSAAFVATAPWTVFYSRKIWTTVNFPYLLPIYLYALYTSGQSGKRWIYFVVGLTAGIALQLHLTGMVLIPITIIYIMIYGIQRRNTFYTLLGWISGYFPLLLDDIKHNWMIISSYWELMINPTVRPSFDGGPSEHRSATIRLFSDLLTGNGLHSKFGSSYIDPKITSLQTIIVIGFLLIGIVYIGLHCLQPLLKASSLRNALQILRQLPKNDMLLVLTFGSIMYYYMFGFTGQASGIQHPHYFNIVVYPLGCLIVARGAVAVFDFLHTHFNRGFQKIHFRLEYIVVILLIFVVIQNIITINTGFSSLEATGGEKEYGKTLENKIQAVEVVIKNSNGRYETMITGRDFEAYAYLFDLLDNSDNILSDSEVIRRESTDIEGNGIRYHVIERVYDYKNTYDLYAETSELIFEHQGIFVFRLDQIPN